MIASVPKAKTSKPGKHGAHPKKVFVILYFILNFRLFMIYYFSFLIRGEGFLLRIISGADYSKLL